MTNAIVRPPAEPSALLPVDAVDDIDQFGRVFEFRHIFQHDRFLGVRHDRVETVWEIIGRGQIT